MDSLQQAGPMAVILLCALACSLLILIGGIGFIIIRSGLPGNLLSLFQEDRRERAIPPRAGGRRTRSRADQIRTQLDREFEGRLGGEASVHPGEDPAILPGRFARAADEGLDSADRRVGRSLSRRRFQRGLDDYDDEMDAYLDDTELL